MKYGTPPKNMPKKGEHKMNGMPMKDSEMKKMMGKKMPKK